MLLYLECCAVLLHFHADNHIQFLIFFRGLAVPHTIHGVFRVVCVFHIVACVVSVKLHVNAFLHEIFVKLVKHIIFSLQIDHWASCAFLVNQVECWHIGVVTHLGVIGAKRRGRVNYSRTVFCGHIVTRYHAECLVGHFHILIAAVLAAKHLVGMSLGIFVHPSCAVATHHHARLHPRHQLGIVQPKQVSTFHMVYHLVRHHLVAALEFWQLTFFHFAVGFQIRAYASLCQNHCFWLCRIWVICLYCHIVNSWVHTQRHVARQRPWCCGPSQEIRFAPLCPLCLWLCD